MAELRSRKQERDHLVRSLRTNGRSWVEIAEVLRQRYRVNVRVALRYAHGWSQRQAADEWNKRWPDELKTFKSFSYWEMWPSSTGHAPSLDTFGRLAELYQCAVSDLLADLPDFRHLDTRTGMPATASPTTATGLPLTGNLAALLKSYLGSSALSERDALSTPRERDQAYHLLVQFLCSWAHTMDRRDVLRVLAWAASAASVLPALSGDEQQRAASVLSSSNRVDAQTIEHIEAVLWRCARQDDALGSQAALNTVLAQRDLARLLEPECPAGLRSRMLSALSEASRQSAWLSFDLNQFDNAAYYYEDARSLAHEAENIALSAFVLCQMSHLATWRGKPRIGIDHAVAAGQWAQRTDDSRLRAYAADVAGRAYAADGQRDASLTALDTAHRALPPAGDQTPSHAYFYDESLHISHRGLCHLELHDAQLAAGYFHQSAATLDQSFTRNTAFNTVELGMTYVQCNDIDEAARLIGDAGEIAARTSSARLLERLKQGRAELQPWKRTPAVRNLDDRLKSYAVV